METLIDKEKRRQTYISKIIDWKYGLDNGWRKVDHRIDEKIVKTVDEDKAKYTKELEAKTVEGVFEIYEYWRKEQPEHKEESERQELSNKPRFEYWNKLSLWKLEEACMLMYKVNPEVTSKSEIFEGDLGNQKPWVDLYHIAVSAIRLGKLPVQGDKDAFRVEVEPKQFCDWHESIGGIVPEEIQPIGEFTLGEVFDPESETYPELLDIAQIAWCAVTNAPNPDSKKSPKQRIKEWVLEHNPNVSKTAAEYIAIVCNWDKKGGNPGTSDE